MDFFENAVKPLGFGTMRLPLKENGEIDQLQFNAMIDDFMAAGYTYFDTAYFYHDGHSEEAVGAGLLARYPRESFILADKLPVSVLAKREHTPREIFRLQQKRSGADFFDMYLLHALDAEYAKTADELGLWDFMQELKAEGLIRHAGFSFHDKAAVLEQILTAHPETEFVQLQINYADWEDKNVQSRLCYEVCVKHNKPVIVMEPVKGGLLASEKGVFAPLLQKAAPDRSLVSWAFRFVHDLPQVKMILSGMSEEAQVQENIALFGGLDPLTEAERQTVAQAREAIQKAGEIGCTACRYCVNGCPEGIHIPRILAVLNSYKRYGSLERAKAQYEYATRGGAKASQCRRCGRCEGVCPQHLYISGYMQEAARLFEN